MLVDVRAGLFQYGGSIDLPGGARETLARKLAGDGLLRLVPRDYVRCVNPLDHDQRWVKDRSCDGRIVLRDGVDEQDLGYRCPDCGRVVFPSRKLRASLVRLVPEDDAISTWLRRSLEAAGFVVHERPAGVFRVEAASGEVHVVLVDRCVDPAALSAAYPRIESTVYVVAADVSYANQIPPGAPRFRVVDLALDSTAPLTAAVAERVRTFAMSPVGEPAVLRATPPLWSMVPLSPPVLTVAEPSVFSSASSSAGFAAPAGCAWRDLAVHYIDGETVLLRVPGRRARRFTYIDMGMASEKTRRPIKRWSILLALCEGSGACDSRQFGGFDVVKTQVTMLRETLRSFTGIEGDPIPTCSRREGLRAAFRAYPVLPDELPYVEETWREGPKTSGP